MMEPRPSVARFVAAVVQAELARDGDTPDSNVARQVLVRLNQELVKLIGPAGFDVLVARSLVLARRGHPVLAGITAGPGGTLAGFDNAAREGVALQLGVAAVVAHFIELLVLLIGEDLAMRLVRDIWPTVEEEAK